jgi:hypothetical protein
MRLFAFLALFEEMHMPTVTRKGRPLTVSLDPDALSLLRAMTPNQKGLGLLLSELLRKEARERAARPQLLELLATQADERLRVSQALARLLEDPHD